MRKPNRAIQLKIIVHAIKYSIIIKGKLTIYIRELFQFISLFFRNVGTELKGQIEAEMIPTSALQSLLKNVRVLIQQFVLLFVIFKYRGKRLRFESQPYPQCFVS